MSEKTPESDGWSMSDEREFIETLLCERFNFFLVIFAATIAGVVTVTTRQHLLLLLCSAAVVQFLMMLTLWRAQCKLDILLRHLKKNQPGHPTAFTDKHAKGPSVRWIIGYGIPTLCTVAVVGALVAAHQGWLLPASGASENSAAESCEPPHLQPPERVSGSGQ